MKTVLRAILVSLTCVSCAAAWATDGVAFLTNLKGEVTLDGSARPQLMAEVGKGQKLGLDKDALVSVMFIQSGKEFALKGPGDYVVNAADITASKGTKPAERQTEWRTSSQALVKVAQSASASIRMRSIAPARTETTVARYPADSAVGTLQPTFGWSAGEVKPTEFSLSTVAEPDNVVHKAKVSGDSYRVPGKLKADTEYMWSVSADGKVIGSARFRTLGADALAQIEKRRPAGKAEFSDRLMYAVMLNDLGATQDAQAAWAKLAQERSDLPELAALGKSR